MPRNIKGFLIAGGEANAVLVPVQNNRQAVILNPPDAGDYQIAFGESATAAPHFRMTAASAPVVLERDTYGEILDREIRVTADVGAVALVSVVSGD